jgi:hypothetical protein
MFGARFGRMQGTDHQQTWKPDEVSASVSDSRKLGTVPSASGGITLRGIPACRVAFSSGSHTKTKSFGWTVAPLTPSPSRVMTSFTELSKAWMVHCEVPICATVCVNVAPCAAVP